MRFVEWCTLRPTLDAPSHGFSAPHSSHAINLYATDQTKEYIELVILFYCIEMKMWSDVKKQNEIMEKSSYFLDSMSRQCVCHTQNVQSQTPPITKSISVSALEPHMIWLDRCIACLAPSQTEKVMDASAYLAKRSDDVRIRRICIKKSQRTAYLLEYLFANHFQYLRRPVLTTSRSIFSAQPPHAYESKKKENSFNATSYSMTSILSNKLSTAA